MIESDSNNCIVVIRYENKIRWFRSDRELWVLDLYKWHNEFVSYGHFVPMMKDSDRFGIPIVNKETANKFINCMLVYEIDKDELSISLAKRYMTAQSWWDVEDLFPIMFLNFDSCKVGAFYHDGIPMERYIPDGWTGEFIDFAQEYPEDIFPQIEKFWIKGTSDLLKLLNERALDRI